MKDLKTRMITTSNIDGTLVVSRFRNSDGYCSITIKIHDFEITFDNKNNMDKIEEFDRREITIHDHTSYKASVTKLAEMLNEIADNPCLVGGDK